MKTAVILAAGKGKKLWPYNQIRPKAMVPIANKPLIGHLVDSLEQGGFERIIIVAGDYGGQIRGYFRAKNHVVVHPGASCQGTAATLAEVEQSIDDEVFAVFYGDTLIAKTVVDQVGAAYKQERIPAVFLRPLDSAQSLQHITVSLKGDTVEELRGRSRGASSYTPCGFLLSKDIFPYLQYNPELFTNLDVGFMPPRESFLEMSLQLWIEDGFQLYGMVADGYVHDIDRPWDILEATAAMTEELCSGITSTTSEAGSSIDKTAVIDGAVHLGENSRIGSNVIIRGNAVIGKNSVVENGALLFGNTVVGDGCYLGNYCQLTDGSVVGNGSLLSHCAELEGIVMEGVYLYHYMELAGIIGRNTDIGAATVCGNLRFDDGKTAHTVAGRREYPVRYAHVAYIGDYCRTGVNAIIMPGCKTGVYSVVGPGVLLNEDLPDNTCIYVKQQQETTSWGPQRYGW
jgi:bifunctional UDP-N-acetylglucosamine pyrophosphorylase/glucosamine-1-phosphate N-acetyltransferase